MRSAKGFSLIELLIVVAIILIIASIAIPNLLRARLSANEASAISGVRSITEAQITYKINNPDTYAASLVALGPEGANLLNADLATPPHQHSGYEFFSHGDVGTFIARATPTSPGSTGFRSFCTDTPSDIYVAPIGDVCVPRESEPLK